MQVGQICADFLRHHDENSSAATTRFYRQGLAWFSKAFGESDWDSLDRLAVKDALFASYHWPDGRPMAPATHRRNKIAFAQIQKHAIDQEFTERTILTDKDLKKPGAGRREKVPTVEQLDAIIAAASPALALAIRGLRACGMRPGELCRADVEMIAVEEGVRAIVIKKHKTARKTGKPRVIAIGQQLAAVIAESVGDRLSGPIWRDERERRWTPDRLSERVRRIRIKLELPKGLTPYTIRHYVGTWVTRKADIFAAKELLGHTSISMTQRYAHGDVTDQLRAQEKLDGTTRKEGE